MQTRRDPPCGTAVDTKCTKGGPTSNDGANGIESQEESSSCSPLRGVRDLGDERRANASGDDTACTEYDSRCNEHAEVGGRSLNDGADHTDESAEGEAFATAELVTDSRDEPDADERSNGIRSVEEAEYAASWSSEVDLPLGDRLETVHH